jgi:hypothetical protein
MSVNKMNKKEFQYPIDLAEIVQTYLISENVEGTPEKEYLKYLFEVMYFASLKTEESQPIHITITYLDPQNPDPKPPQRILEDRWSYIKFDKEIEFNIQNLVKLSKAADPKASSLAVGIIDNKLVICGMIDQENNYYNFILFESNEGPERPGLFQATIENLGEITVYKRYAHIGSLKKNYIKNKHIEVFSNGPVANLLDQYMSPTINIIKEKVDVSIFGERDHWEKSLKNDIHSLLCRILINIQNYRHGGAILIDPNISLTDLNIKYKIQYDRLNKLMVNYGEKTIISTFLENKIFEDYYDKDETHIPLRLHNKLSVTNDNLEDIQDGITGAIKYISSLSCVDGLVLFDNNLIVKGFGVEITTNEQPEIVVLAQDEEMLDLKTLDYNHFGTRHRSMMRYCYKNPGSLGFVISQDGDIRAMTTLNGTLVIWENINVLLSFES